MLQHLRNLTDIHAMQNHLLYKASDLLEQMVMGTLEMGYSDANDFLRVFIGS